MYAKPAQLRDAVEHPVFEPLGIKSRSPDAEADALLGKRLTDPLGGDLIGGFNADEPDEILRQKGQSPGKADADDENRSAAQTGKGVNQAAALQYLAGT